MYCLSANLFLAETSSWWAKLADWLSQALSIAWPIALLAFGLGMLIFVHELGHFLAAKFVGIRVDVFSLGFGRRLLGFKRGETDYRISALPLGGYIKMLGQDDLHPENRVDDERAFCNKSVGRRFVVIACGVIMNIICALGLFVILFRFIGVDFQRPEVGRVAPDSPAQRAGILPGDTILAVDGKDVRDFGEIRSRLAVAPRDREFPVLIQRPGAEGPLELSVRSEYLDSKAVIREIGIDYSLTLTIDNPGAYSGAGGLKEGDEIIGLEFDDEPHYYDKYYQFAEAINARRDSPTSIIALRNGQRLEPIMVRPRLGIGSHVMGMIPPARVVYVEQRSPADEAGLKPGDVITSCNNYAWADVPAVAEIAKRAGRENQEIPISVLRAGKIINLRIKPRKNDKQGALGIELGTDHQNLYVANDYSELHKQKAYIGLDLPADERIDVPPQAKLLSLNGRRLTNWSDLIGKLEERAGKKADLKYSLNGEEHSLSFVVPPTTSSVWEKQWRFLPNLSTEVNLIKVKDNSLIKAMHTGLRKTWFWMQSTYQTLVNLMRGGVKPGALHGPVGIAHLSVVVVRKAGVVYFFYLMAIIGVNLAIINFLPIPVLDGGHALFLLFEKIKGSPVSVKVQTVASTVALGAIGVFFLFVTYNDIARIVHGWLG